MWTRSFTPNDLLSNQHNHHERQHHYTFSVSPCRCNKRYTTEEDSELSPTLIYQVSIALLRFPSHVCVCVYIYDLWGGGEGQGGGARVHGSFINKQKKKQKKNDPTTGTYVLFLVMVYPYNHRPPFYFPLSSSIFLPSLCSKTEITE